MSNETNDNPRFFWFGESTEICAAKDFEQALEFSCYEFDEDEPRDDQWGELPADYTLSMMETDENERPIKDEPTTQTLLEWYRAEPGMPQIMCSAYN